MRLVAAAASAAVRRTHGSANVVDVEALAPYRSLICGTRNTSAYDARNNRSVIGRHSSLTELLVVLPNRS